MRGNIKILLILVLIGLALRLPFLSLYLEDWDSVQFALGLTNYSIAQHQPHPPGYPLYILLGKIFWQFSGNDTLALTLLSGILGSLATVPLFLLVKKMFDQKTAIISSILFLVIPISWTLSEVALTNIPGLFFLLVFIYLLYQTKDNLRNLLLTSLLGGFILGVRFTELPIILALLSLVLMKHLSLKRVFVSLLFFILGVSLWMIPVVVLTGFDKFLESYSWIANYVIKHDALVEKRFESLWYLLKVGYTPYFIIFGFGAVLISLFKKELIKQFRFQFLIVWLISYAIPLIFIYNLEVPRYTLPLLPPLVILSSTYFTHLIKKNRFLIIILVVILISLFKQSFSQVNRFYLATPPTIAAVNYVTENFDPKNTIVIASFTYRQFQYYAPQFLTYYGKLTTLEDLIGDKTVIIDYLGLKDQINLLKKFEIVETKNFSGDKDIFTRIPSVNIYILKPITKAK